MNLTDILQKLAERTPEPEPVYWVDSRPLCVKCRMNEVDLEGDYCKLCSLEQAQGYEALSMTGRCANGFQRDSGTLYHAVMFGKSAAVCGAKHGKRSRWSEYHGEKVTCPRCNKKLTGGAA